MQQDNPENQNNQIDRDSQNDSDRQKSSNNPEKYDKGTSENASTSQNIPKAPGSSIAKPRRKSLSVTILDPDRTKPDADDDVELAAQVVVTPDGGWGWVVLFGSFLSLAIMDGTVFGYGPMLPEICKEFQIAESLAAIVNSVLIAVCFMACPFSSALINRFGFRAICMTGSIISSFATLVAYFSTGFIMLLIFYSILNGIGSSMIVISSSLVVGFYFERLRSIVMPIVSTGAPIGTMTMYPINCTLVSLTGWRNTVLWHASLVGLIYFLGLTYRPLPTLMVTEEPAEIEQVHSLHKVYSKRKSFMVSNPRLSRPISNVNFPTVAEMLKEASTETGSDSPKKKPSRITFSTTYSEAETEQYQKVIPLASTLSISKNKIENETPSTSQEMSKVKPNVGVQKPKKRKCCGGWCKWTKNPEDARPIYRDDVFYEGKLQSLPAYQRSVMAVDKKDRTGLEYQLEVTRSMTMHDINEKPGVFTTACRRILATIFDPRLLKQRSFLLFCFAGLFSNTGLLVPYIFIQARGLAKGLNPSHAMMLVSVISFSNLVGRLTAIVLAVKIKSQNIFVAGLCIAGVATILSGLSNTSVYQFGYCIVFGFCMAHSSLRSIALVELFGLENLTSSTGIVLMFGGVGNLFGSPLASVIRNAFGYDAAFYFSGSFITFAGLMFFLIRF